MLVRTDLLPSQQFVQSCHAALEAGKHFCQDPTSPVDHLIVLTVPDEEALIKAKERVEARGVNLILFREPDLKNEATCFCTEPIGGDLRKVFSNYPLWKEKELCMSS